MYAVLAYITNNIQNDQLKMLNYYIIGDLNMELRKFNLRKKIKNIL